MPFIDLFSLSRSITGIVDENAIIWTSYGLFLSDTYKQSQSHVWVHNWCQLHTLDCPCVIFFNSVGFVDMYQQILEGFVNLYFIQSSEYHTVVSWSFSSIVQKWKEDLFFTVAALSLWLSLLQPSLPPHSFTY